MMPNAVLTLNLTVDGVPVADFPYIRRANPTSLQVLTAFQKTADNNTTSFTAIPGIPADLQMIVLTTDSALNIRLNASTTAFPLSANGIFMIFASDLLAGTLTNITLNNPSASTTANVYGAFAGT